IAAALLGGRADLSEARVAFFIPPSFDHIAVQWGIWRAGGLAVPLALSHPPAELEYVVRDAGAGLLIGTRARAEVLEPAARAAGARLVAVEDLLQASLTRLPAIRSDRRALMVYTSGTTGKPKGVVTTHANLEAQITALIEAWAWTPEDRILL